VREGVCERILEALTARLKERGGFDRSACFSHGTCSVAKRESGCVGTSHWGQRDANAWQCQTALVYLSPSGPLRLRLASVGPVAAPLDSRRVAALPPASHGRSRLRCRSARRRAGNARGRDAGAASAVAASSPRPRRADRCVATSVAGRSNASSPRLRQFPPPRCALRALCSQLPRLRPARLHPHPPPPGFMRWFVAQSGCPPPSIATVLQEGAAFRGYPLPR
jgi:hypothetical protein